MTHDGIEVIITADTTEYGNVYSFEIHCIVHFIGVFFFVIEGRDNRINHTVFLSCYRNNHIHMLPGIGTVTCYAKAVRYLQVSEYARSENAHAITVNAGLAFSPRPCRSTQLFESWFIQFVLDIVINKFPDGLASRQGGRSS